MKKPLIGPMERPNRMIEYWKKEPAIVFSILFFGVFFNGLMFLSPIYQGKLIDALVEGEDKSQILWAGLVFVSIVLMIQTLRYFKRFYVRRFANITNARMRRMIYNNRMNRNPRDLDKESSGSLMNRVIQDVDLCVEGMRKFTTEVFDTGVLMLSYLIALLVYDVKITAFAILFIPLAMFIAEKMKTAIYRYSSAYRKKTGEVADQIYDSIDNSMLFRITGMESKNRFRMEKDLEDLESKAVKANILENSMQPVYYAISLIGIVFVLWLGGNKVIEGNWTIGTFSAYVVMFLALSTKASKAAKLFNSVQKSRVSWKRIQPYLTEYVRKEPFSSVLNPKTELEVSHLTVTQEGTEIPILKDLSFVAQSPQMIGITGPIASGKSTLGEVLAGLSPYLGSVKIDGKELKDYSEAERAAMIGYLGHHPQLMSDSIRNNIAIGDEIDLKEVLSDIRFWEDLTSMPDGENTVVGNAGIRLSGGQQARIALARTLLHKKKVIILDDPFSAVDMKTEAEILKNLKNHYPETLFFLISHRVTVFDQLDQILLLQNDHSFSIGTNRELTEKSPLYASIRQLQLLEGGNHHEENNSR